MWELPSSYAARLWKKNNPSYTYYTGLWVHQGAQGSAVSVQHPWVIMAYLLVQKLYSNDQKEYITFVSK